MHAEFWLQRWREGRTGFHRDEVMPLLAKHWSSLALPEHSRVLVPLAGKSRDMLWLAAQGHRVLGVELSPLAVGQFFDENDLEPTIHESAAGPHFVAGPVELICGDLFDLDADAVSECAGVYDRAALIALPADMRRRYASHLSRILPAASQMLLITLDYPQAEMEGPPFSVDSEEVAALYADAWQTTRLERRDILADDPKFAEGGVSVLHTDVWRLHRFR